MTRNMQFFSIGEVEKITGIKAHVLRYWEEKVCLLQPQKDTSGRRIYSNRDIDFIFKLDYLINKQKYTVEGAANELLNKAINMKEEYATISEIRGELLSIYKLLKRG